MKTAGPATFHLKDIWEAYTYKLLASNPDFYIAGTTGTKDKVKNYYIVKKHIDEHTGRPKVIDVINYDQFRAVLVEYFQQAKLAIIEGEAVDMLSCVGRIFARRVERDMTTKRINFFKTAKQPKIWNEEKQRMEPERIVYETRDDWCRIGLVRIGKIKNETVYEFAPTSTTKSGIGFKQQFGHALEANKNLRYKYPYFRRHKKPKP